MAGTLDAQLSGIVKDLARPGGNVTCLTLISVQLVGNRLSLPEEAVPAATRLRFLTTRTATGTPMARTLDRVTRAMETGAQRVGMELRTIAAFGADQIKASFAITTCCDAPVACCGTDFRGGPERPIAGGATVPAFLLRARHLPMGRARVAVALLLRLRNHRDRRPQTAIEDRQRRVKNGSTEH